MLAEDTGFSDHLPTSCGLLCFNDLEEAVAGVAKIDRNYPQHMRTDRELGQEYLSSKKRLRLCFPCVAGNLAAQGCDHSHRGTDPFHPFLSRVLFISANSPTHDEATHLAAGYSYFARRDFPV